MMKQILLRPRKKFSQSLRKKFNQNLGPRKKLSQNLRPNLNL